MSKSLMLYAKRAARAHAAAQKANHAWVQAFEEKYGHTEIQDTLVEAIDYCTGNVEILTNEFIHQHSEKSGI